MLFDAGRAVAHRRRDVQSSLNLIAPLLLLWFLACPFISTISYSHSFLLPPFDANGSSERGRWCSPASHYCHSPRSTPRVPKTAKVEACASICLDSSKSENCLNKSPRAVRSITFPGYLRRNFANINVDGPTSTSQSSPTILRLYRSSPYWFTSIPQLPATTTPTPIFSSSPSSRRTNTNSSIDKNLGFPLLGPSCFGPLLSSFQPIYGFWGPTSLLNWTRYALSNHLFSPLNNLLPHVNWNGRRHISNLVATPYQWLSDDHTPTLLRSSSHVISADCKPSPEKVFHWISLTAGDDPGPLLASFPVRMSRTHDNSFFWMEIFLFEKFSKLESMKLSSTSQCLLIRTIHHLPELIANVVSTYLGLACDLMLLCSRLRVLLDLLSNYLSFISEFYNAISFVVFSLYLAKTLHFVTFPPFG